MRFVKFLCVLLAAVLLFSVCAFAAPTTTSSSSEPDNVAIMEDEFFELLSRNGINKKNVSFAYLDLSREFEYVYNGDRLFEPYEVLKFPLAYLYFKDLVAGKHHLNEDVGKDNLRTAFLRSLTKDYNHDGNATELLLEKYGGLEQLKKDMHEITYTKVPDEFFTSEQVTANYLIDFMETYYREAFSGSSDYKNMLINPIKSLSPNRFSETYIYDAKVIHRYGFSKEAGVVADIGIVNTATPFAFVIEVDGVKDPEEEVASIAEFAYDWNMDYGDLLISQMTTLPDVPDNEKQNYDARKTYKTPMMIALIASTVVIAAAVTVVYIVSENKKKNQDRLD